MKTDEAEENITELK